MSEPSAEEVIDAFTNVVRDELEQGNDVEIPLLGRLRVEHEPSAMTEEDDDRFLSPPRNVVVFDPIQE